MPNKKRKICFVITSTVHYGRSKLVLKELKRNKSIELQIVVGGSAILPNYGDVISFMEHDGFSHDAKITMVLEGGTPVAMAKTAGIGMSEFASVFDNLKPDLVVVRGDRYEVLGAAVAAAYLNIPVAHLEGGDVTGTIDESVRHAITKLSHIHFATNEEAAKRILRMGEHPDYVFNVGSPEIEYAARHDHEVTNTHINKLGVGDAINLDKDFIMVMYHPVTTERGANRKNTEEILHAIHNLNIPTLWFWPNVDAGTDEVSKGIRVFRELHEPQHMRFIKYVPPDMFMGLLKKATVLVGNSSAGIKESSFIGVPVVNVGSRQTGRLRAHNVIDVPHDKKKIAQAVEKQMKHGKYKSSRIYYKKGTSERIARILAKTPLYVQKRFVDRV